MHSHSLRRDLDVVLGHVCPHGRGEHFVHVLLGPMLSAGVHLARGLPGEGGCTRGGGGSEALEVEEFGSHPRGALDAYLIPIRNNTKS